MTKKYRIGIDVGGTFTDAAILDNDSYELVAKQKIRTTHEEGVAVGIVEIISKILVENNIKPEQVVFIAHGTTQATNALLEADVAKVGIIGMGESKSAKKETIIDDIELSQGKFLHTACEFISSKSMTDKAVKDAYDSLSNQGAEVFVISEAYSVDNPENEKKVNAMLVKQKALVTTGHEISELYGLKMRTRTATINASLIPKMIQTADMTEYAVKTSKITSELMIMRCDGGVMNIEEVRNRPILTMLSGLAAGVAGALMYEKVSDGIFLEVGGTSIDVTVIKNGKVMIKNAQVGGHKTYVQSLDVRTDAIAGGTMVRVKDSKINQIGPRSSHIAGAEYDCFIEDYSIDEFKLKYISPKAQDPQEYAVLVDQLGTTVAFTLCGAANLLGLVPKNDYAFSQTEFNRQAWGMLGKSIGCTGEEAATIALDIALDTLNELIEDLIVEYELDKNIVTIVGGGGSAGVIAPSYSEKYGYRWKIAENAPFISTIGVALALVREQLERTIVNPTNDDIRKIREDIKEKIVKSGAKEETVEISIEVDTQKNIVRAIASGSTELRTKNLGDDIQSVDEMAKVAKYNLNTENINFIDNVGRWNIFEGIEIKKQLFGLLKKKITKLCVIDRSGIVRFKNSEANYTIMEKSSIPDNFDSFINQNTIFSDANATIPKVFVFFREKMVDLSGLQTMEQLGELLSLETEFVDSAEKLLIVAYQ